MFRSRSFVRFKPQALLCARRLAVFVGFGLLLTPANLAQYRFDSWTTDNGLPQNGIRQITQTPDGYLWFTTFDGLVRFDGVKFTVFSKGNSPGILNNRFGKLISDKHGTLWAQTEDQMLTVYRDGVFTTYDNTQIPEHDLVGFYTDADGEVLLVTKSANYYLRDGKFIFAKSRGSLGPWRIEFDASSGAKWILTPDKVEQYRNGNLTVYPLNTINRLDPGAAITDEVFEDSHGALWLGVVGVGAVRLLDGKIMVWGEKDGISFGAFPRFFREERDGSIWFSTGDSNTPGAGVFQWKDSKLSRFGLELGLSNDRVMGLFRDREDTLWVATDKGINRLRTQVITSYSKRDGLAADEVYPILRSRDGGVVIGTTRGTSVFRDGKLSAFIAPARSGTPENIQALAEDPTGEIWFGVVGDLISYKNGRSTVYGTGNTVAVVPSRYGGVWSGSNTGLFRIENNRVTARFTTAEGLASNEVKVILEENDGSLWVGTYGGLSHLVSGKFTNYSVKDGLPSDRVRSLYRDKDGALWIGTYDGGLSRFKNGKFFNFTTDNGLYNNGVFATIEDDFGNFWMSCNRGIYRVNKQQLNDFADGKINAYESFAYGKEDGMRNTECNGGRQPSALKDNDGRIWFPTLEGVAVVDPRLVKNNPVPPPVVIETVAVDRTTVPEPQKLAAVRDLQKTITVQPSQTSVDISYTGLSFVKSDQIRFRYKLDGLDPKWIDAGTRRTVNYSYLPPGTYTFTVIAANSDGVWNNQGQSIRIVVLAPFYRTWWFRVLLVLALLGIGFALYRYRVAQLRKVHRAREAFSQEMIDSQEAFSRQLIESQEGERKRIAAELHDSLGQNLLVIKNRALLGLAVAEKERSKEQFGEIQESVTQALSEVRSIAYNLRPLHLERLGLTSTIEEAIEQVQSASGIRFDCDIAPLDDLFRGDAEINFYRIVQECLNNIVKHSGGSVASVTIHRTDNAVSLTVKDNGRGFDLEQLQREHRMGLGLNGIAERVKILGGTYSVDSRPLKGTTIKIEVESVPSAVADG